MTTEKEISYRILTRSFKSIVQPSHIPPSPQKVEALKRKVLQERLAGRTWELQPDAITCQAKTKSEARAKFKTLFNGTLPKDRKVMRHLAGDRPLYLCKGK